MDSTITGRPAPPSEPRNLPTKNSRRARGPTRDLGVGCRKSCLRVPALPLPLVVPTPQTEDAAERHAHGPAARKPKRVGEDRHLDGADRPPVHRARTDKGK